MASAMRRAMTVWSRVGSCRVVPAGVGPGGSAVTVVAEGVIGASGPTAEDRAGASVSTPAARRTSRRVIRPSGPVPSTSESPIPCSSAMRRASGVAVERGYPLLDRRRRGGAEDDRARAERTLGFTGGSRRRRAGIMWVGGLRGRSIRAGSCCQCALLDPSDRFPHRDGGSLGGEDLQDSACVGGVGDCGLVGLDLQQFVAGVNLSTGLLEPAENRALLIESESLGIKMSVMGGSLQQVNGGTHDRVSVDAEMAVEVLDVAGLAEIVNAEARDRRTANRGEKAQRVWVSVHDGDDRRRPVVRKQDIEDPRLTRAKPLTSLKRSKHAICRRKANDVAGHAGGRKLLAAAMTSGMTAPTPTNVTSGTRSAVCSRYPPPSD